MFFRRILSLSALLSSALADITFTSPAAGSSIAGTTIDVEWTNSGSPALTSYTLFLCAGGNDADSYIQLATLKDTGDFADGDTISVTVQPTVGANTKNAYFLRMISAAATGSIISYSKRFTLSAMTGTFPPVVITGLSTVTGTDGPADTDQTAQIQQQAPAAVASSSSSIDSASYSLAYSMQSGGVRYAPMPPVPGSKITAKGATPLFPTSAFNVFTVAAGPPGPSTTITESLTYSVSSREATIAAAGMPADSDMQKFLNRWKD